MRRFLDRQAWNSTGAYPFGERKSCLHVARMQAWNFSFHAWPWLCQTLAGMILNVNCRTWKSSSRQTGQRTKLRGKRSRYWLASWANEPYLKPPFDLLMLCHSQQFASNSDFFLGDAASGKLDGRCKLARKMKELVLASGMFQRLLRLADFNMQHKHEEIRQRLCQLWQQPAGKRHRPTRGFSGSRQKEGSTNPAKPVL